MDKKILIVEDEATLAQALSYEFNQQHFQTVVAKNGEEGLKMAETEKPDLILCDIAMPVMDGLTMLKQMRTTDWGRNIPVMMLTNFSDEDKVMEALAQQAFYYLVKSDWDLSQIVAKVKEKLGM